MSFFRKDLDVLDPGTGEILGKLPYLTKGKANLEGDFVMARQEGFLRLARDKDLTGDDYRVLNVFFGNLDFEKLYSN